MQKEEKERGDEEQRRVRKRGRRGEREAEDHKRSVQ